MCTEPLHGWMRMVPQLHPVADISDVATIGCPVLVIGQRGDEAHPSRLVGDLVEALPDARGEVLAAGGVLWSHRAQVRAMISAFLNEPG